MTSAVLLHVSTVMSFGQLITGGLPEPTAVITTSQTRQLPEASQIVRITTVTLPGGSTVPGAIDCVTVIRFDGVQLSVINPLVWKFGITGGQPVTLMENGGQFGGVVSPPVTMTRKPHEAMLPCASVAVQVTVLVPSGKNEPDGGMQTTLAIGVPQALVTTGLV